MAALFPPLQNALPFPISFSFFPSAVNSGLSRARRRRRSRGGNNTGIYLSLLIIHLATNRSLVMSYMCVTLAGKTIFRQSRKAQPPNDIYPSGKFLWSSGGIFLFLPFYTSWPPPPPPLACHSVTGGGKGRRRLCIKRDTFPLFPPCSIKVPFSPQPAYVLGEQVPKLNNNTTNWPSHVRCPLVRRWLSK